MHLLSVSGTDVAQHIAHRRHAPPQRERVRNISVWQLLHREVGFPARSLRCGKPRSDTIRRWLW
jgi:hypothetical protein